MKFPEPIYGQLKADIVRESRNDTLEMLDIPQLHEMLQPIVGEPLSDMYRAIGQVFEFGVQRPDTNRKGQAITRADISLKFICADYRVVQGGRLILGSSDFSPDDDQFFNLDEPTGNAFEAESWRLGKDFFRAVDEARFVVESINVGRFGDVTIQLSNDLLVQSFGSSGQDMDLWWFANERTDFSCLVFPSGHCQGRRAKS